MAGNIRQIQLAQERRDKIPKLIGIMLVNYLLLSCATATRQSDGPMIPYDADTEYSVQPRADGFSLTINYSKYQFIPESNAIAAACKSAVTSIAYDYAEKQGKKIQPINEQRIRISTGRNGLTGVTSCSATAVAEWKPK